MTGPIAGVVVVALILILIVIIAAASKKSSGFGGGLGGGNLDIDPNTTLGVADFIGGGGGVQGTQFDRLMTRGKAARGILLQVAPTGTMGGNQQRRFQSRAVTIDIEIPGQQPYVVQAFPLIPMNLVRDVLPGATLEIRVDPSDPSNIAIVGPGAGFSPTFIGTGTALGT